MNKWVMGALLLTSGIYNTALAEHRVVPVSEITKQDLDEVQKSMSKKEEEGLVVIFQKGDRLPVNLVAKGGILHLDGPLEAAIVFDDTVYVRADKGIFYFSKDFKTWKSFDKFFTGETGVALTADDNKEPTFQLWCSLNMRK